MGTVEKLREVMDELVGMDPSQLGDADTVLELYQQFDRFEAVVCRSSAAFDASHDWVPSHSRSAADWLAWQRHMSKATAARRVRLGRELRSLPVAEQAWLAGEIGSPHVVQLAKTRTPVTAEAMARDEQMLVDQAMDLSYNAFHRAMAYWLGHADPDGAEDDAAAKYERRHLDLSKSFDDMWFGNFTLDAIGGTIVHEEIQRLAKELFGADWAEAKARLGRDPGIHELSRTPGQRRADALREMATRSRMAPAGGRRPEPLFSVLVDYETLAGRICELANRIVVTPGQLVPWLDRAWLERVVFDGPSAVKDVGIHQRLFTGGTRRAVEVRDQECFHPTCEEPADSCQIDHIDPYGTGGPTTETNGQVACGFHNRDRQRRT
jgi:hypothetical protein